MDKNGGMLIVCDWYMPILAKKYERERERGVSESFFLSALMTYTCSILVFEIEKSEHQNLKKNMEIVYTNKHVRFISKIVTDWLIKRCKM